MGGGGAEDGDEEEDDVDGSLLEPESSASNVEDPNR